MHARPVSPARSTKSLLHAPIRERLTRGATNASFTIVPKNFVGKWDETYAAVWKMKSKAEDPKAFKQVVAELMGELIAKAAGARETLKFKSGESSPKGYYDNNVTIYGMAQCTQDLCELECNRCLESSLETMVKYCGDRDGCRIFGSSCVLRYKIFKFLFLDDAVGVEAPAPAPSVGAGN